MNKRLEQAIEGVIYWRKAYVHSRERFNETQEPRYNEKIAENYLHILSSSEWLKQVYEQETGKKVTTIGNLPEVEVLNESFPIIIEPDL